MARRRSPAAAASPVAETPPGQGVPAPEMVQVQFVRNHTHAGTAYPVGAVHWCSAETAALLRHFGVVEG